MIHRKDREFAGTLAAIIYAAKLIRTGEMPTDQTTIGVVVNAAAAIINQVDKHLPPRER